MNIHDWIKSKLKYLKPLNEYPVGSWLPFKSKDGYYIYVLDTNVWVDGIPYIEVNYYHGKTSGRHVRRGKLLTLNNKHIYNDPKNEIDINNPIYY